MEMSRLFGNLSLDGFCSVSEKLLPRLNPGNEGETDFLDPDLFGF